MTFEIGKTYTGTGFYGNCSVLVTKKTEKTIYFIPEHETKELKRKLRTDGYQDGREHFSHHAWYFMSKSC